ncbi:MAG: hypothetical protein KBC05_17885 [Candidatus Hydrogenedentes bacterium]|nr:hypothetical protein [Candidatus Hydrogenedentota bacterium]
MRRLSIIVLTACLVACACFAADINSAELVLDLGAAETEGTVTSVNGYNGFIDSIYVSCSDGVSTGNVVVSTIPADALMAAIVVATNDVTATKVFRPRVDVTDTAGTGLADDGPERYILAGEKIKMAVTGSESGIVWKATVNMAK